MADQLVPAKGAYLEQILNETFPIWNEGLREEQYGRFWEAQLRTPWGSSHLDRVALVEKGSVTSSAKRYDLSARLDGRIRRILGIGAVFTSPGRRGRGGAKRMLELMFESGEAEGYEYAMLFSEIESAFYEQLDFVPVPLVESRLEMTRGRGTPAVLVRYGDERDIANIAEMSARRAETARFALDRSEDLIRFGLTKRRLLAGFGSSGLREVEFLVTEEGHQAVAYLISTIHEGQWFIEEAGDRDPTGARLGAMLQLMLARTPHLDPPVIRGWLPHALTPQQVASRTDASTAEVLMIRPLKDRTLPLPPLDAHQVIYWHADYF